MADGNRALFAVVGAAVIGYIGSESAHLSFFERLLWPQRFYNGADFKDAAFIALFMPMGGPLYKASLEAFDRVHKSGILKSDRAGNMLGTPFLGDTGLRQKVTKVSKDLDEPPEHWQNQARQCLWSYVVDALPLPRFEATNKRRESEAGSQRHIVRQEVCTDHITLTPITKPPQDAIVVGHENKALRVSQYGLICLSEATAIFSMILGVAVWRTWFGLIFLAPLILKLSSACLAVKREGLICKPRSLPDRKLCMQNGISADFRLEFDSDFCVITSSIPSRGMLVLSGPYACTKQFSRHYGHPVRSHAREWAQLCCILGFGLIFPVGLVLSTAYMPPSLQYYWIGYQLYACLTMHVYRYFGGHECGNFATRLARILHDAKAPVVLRNEAGEHLSVKMRTTWHPGWKEAKDDAYGLCDCLVKAEQHPSTPRKEFES